MRKVSAFLHLHKFGILIAVVLGVGAFMRLYRISEYMTFLGDEGRDVLVVKQMIVDHKFTLLGPTASVGGFFLGPIYYYFMLPFLWLWRLDPTGPAVMVALFGIATIYLIFRFTSKTFSPSAGLAASALYAVSPLVIAYSRSSWNPNVVPFFALGLMYFLLQTSSNPRMRYWFLTGLMLGIGIQLHYLFLFLYAACGVYIAAAVAFRVLQIRAKHVIAAVSGYVAGISLFLAFELRHGFTNTNSVVRFLAAGNDTGFSASGFFNNVQDISFRLFARLLLHMPDANRLSELPVFVSRVWQAAALVLLLGSLYILMRNLQMLRTSIKSSKPAQVKKMMPYLLLAVWFVVPVFLFGLYKRAIYDYYLGIMFPLPFILTGILVSAVSGKKRYLPAAVAVMAGLLYLNWEGRPFKYAPNNQLQQVRRIAEVAFRETDEKPFNFALITDGNSDHAYRYFFEIWGKPPVTIENAAVDPERTTVTDQLIIICEKVESDCQPLGNSLWEIAGFGRAEIEGSWKVPFVTVYRLGHYRE